MSSQKPSYSAKYKQSWALIVGIDDYQHLPPLQTAVKGAKDVARVFREQLSFEVTELYDSAATRETILRWFGKLKPDPDDRVVFYYAGHGVTQNLRNRNKGFLALAKSDGYWDSLAMDDILDEADALPAKHVLYLLDACFSGIALRGREGDFGIKRTVDYLLTRPARYAITAGGEEVVDDAAAGDYSLYTYWLLQALADKKLQADGMLRAKEVGLYIEANVSAQRHSRALPNHGYLHGSGDGDFLFSWDAGIRLPYDLEMALESSLAEVRWGAVAAVINIAKGDDHDLALVARERLELLAHDDADARVRGAAQSLFDEEEAIRQAEAQRIRDEEARMRLEEARRKQEEADRIAREAEESLQVAQRRAEEERLLAEQAEQERQEALQAALKQRQITGGDNAPSAPAGVASIAASEPESDSAEQARFPNWAWVLIGIVLTAGVLYGLAFTGYIPLPGESATALGITPRSRLVPRVPILESEEFDQVPENWTFGPYANLSNGSVIVQPNIYWDGVFTEVAYTTGQTILFDYQFESNTAGGYAVETGTWQTSTYHSWGLINEFFEIRPTVDDGLDEMRMEWDQGELSPGAGQRYTIAIYIGGGDDPFRMLIWPSDDPTDYLYHEHTLDVSEHNTWSWKFTNGETGQSTMDRWELVEGWPWDE